MANKTPSQTAEQLRQMGVTNPVVDVQDNLGDDIQLVSESDLATLASDESFMNDRLVIRLATTTDDNAPPVADVTVNNAANRVVIPRGVPMQVKRMHVEVLARMKETRYTQPGRNMLDPESGNALVGRTALVYPFEVLKDPNPRGHAWLENILAERG